MPKRSFTKHGHFALVLVPLLALLAVANFWTPNHSFDNAIARVPDANVIETESSIDLARSDSGSKSSSSESSTSEPQSEPAVEQTDDGYEGKDLQVRKADWEACLKRGERLEELVKMQTISKAEQTESTKYGDLTKNATANGIQVFDDAESCARNDHLTHGPRTGIYRRRPNARQRFNHTPQAPMRHHVPDLGEPMSGHEKPNLFA